MPWRSRINWIESGADREPAGTEPRGTELNVMRASYSVGPTESRREARQSSVIWLVLLLVSACVDPFEQETTTPAKLRREKRSAAATKAQPANEAGRESARSGEAKKAGDKGEEKEKKQSYREAWELICNAESLSKTPPGGARDERGAVVASWIVENVTNTKARYWFIDFGNVKEQDKRALFLAEVKRVGLAECPLAELLFEAQGGAPAPEAEPRAPGGPARR